MTGLNDDARRHLLTAKAKLLKAAQLVNQAEGLALKAAGGVPEVHEATKAIMAAITGIEKIVLAQEVTS